MESVERFIATRKSDIILPLNVLICFQSLYFLAGGSITYNASRAYYVALSFAFTKYVVLVAASHGLPRRSTLSKFYNGFVKQEPESLLSLQRVFIDKNALYTMYCGVLLTTGTRPLVIGLFPFFMSAAYKLATSIAHLPVVGAYIGPGVARFLPGEKSILEWNALSEFFTLVILFFNLFTPFRSILGLLAYGQVLHTRYQSSSHSKLAASKINSWIEAGVNHQSCPSFVRAGWLFLKSKVDQLSRMAQQQARQRFAPEAGAQQ